METRPKVTPKDFFLWAGAMATLYTSAVAFLALVFNFIDHLFPDPVLNYYVDLYSSGMRFAVASLVVVFPLYLALTHVLNQDIRRAPEKKDLWVRRWLVFITLFAAGIALAADLIMLINGFLGGELTTRFTLKALSVFVVVGAGFLYYFYDFRGRWEGNEAQSKLIGATAAIVVVVSLIGSFFVTGSPVSQRMYRADEQKISDLQTIQWQLVNYWQQKERLPATISAIEDPLSGFVLPTDKETGASYEYRLVSPLSFELCATFNRGSGNLSSKDSIARPATPYYPGIEGENWRHAEGRQCFARTIDPDRYPPLPKGR